VRPRRKLAELLIPGAPVTKKNSPVPVFLGIPKGMGPGLHRFHGMLLTYLEAGKVGKVRWALTQAMRPRNQGGIAPLILSSDAYRAWAKTAIPALRAQWGARKAVGGPDELLHVVARFYLARMGPRNMGGDVAGYYQACSDALQDAGVLADDCYIESWAGSERIRCPERPRTEVVIYALAGDSAGQGRLEL
jgi:hypothetical protein